MQEMSGWLRGWKDIAAYCGGLAVNTVRKYYKQYGMPIHRLPGGKPVALPSELDLWLIEMNASARRRVKGEG